MFKTNTNEKVLHRKIRAFTLAEVLITLGIIGIVAALTIPIINKATQDMEKKSKVKKAYSTIYNATNEIMQENGGDMRMSVEGLNGTSGNDYKVISTFYKNQYKSHFKSFEDCDTKISCQGKLWPVDTEWYTPTGAKVSTEPGGYGYYAAILGLDGTTYRFYIYNNNCNYSGLDQCGIIMFDINGMKKPNKLGDDIYELYIQKQKIIPVPALITILQNK